MRITEPWDPLGTYFVKDTVDDLFAGGGRLMSRAESRELRKQDGYRQPTPEELEEFDFTDEQVDGWAADPRSQASEGSEE